MAKHIDAAEISRQKDFILKLVELSARFCEENGRKPLANTETYGCQQNENDTERIRGMLLNAGYDFCENAEDADLVVIRYTYWVPSYSYIIRR